jgi:hypothetical protein
VIHNCSCGSRRIVPPNRDAPTRVPDCAMTAHVWAYRCRRRTVDGSESEHLVIDSISFFKGATVDSHRAISLF